MLFTPYLKSCGMDVVNVSSSGQFILDRSRSWSMGRESMLASWLCFRRLIGMGRGNTYTSIRTILVRRAHCTARRSGSS